MIERHLDRHPAAKRIAHEGRAFDAVGLQRAIERVGEQGQRVVDVLRLRGSTVTDHVGKDDAVARADKGIDIVTEVRRA